MIPANIPFLVLLMVNQLVTKAIILCFPTRNVSSCMIARLAAGTRAAVGRSAPDLLRALEQSGITLPHPHSSR